MPLKGEGMPARFPGDRVRIPRAGGALGTVLRGRALQPRIFEAIVRLDDGRLAVGLTTHMPLADASDPPAPPTPELPHVTET